MGLRCAKGVSAVLLCVFFAAVQVSAAEFEPLFCLKRSELKTDGILHYASEVGDMPTLEALKNHPAPAHSAEFVRVRYGILGVRGTEEEGSGLVIFPDAQGEIPVLVYNIGATFDSRLAPSNPELCPPALVMAILFVSQGYAVVMPDYIGQGAAATVPHPFLHRETTVNAVLGLLDAVKPAFAERGLSAGALFMSGMSQGGWATVASVREYERRGGAMAAAMPIAPVLDLPAMTGSCFLVRGSLEPMKPFAPWLCAKLLLSLKHVYGLDISGMFRPGMEDLFAEKLDGAHAFTELLKTLPVSFAEIFTQQGMMQILVPDGELKKRLKENSCVAWAAKTPFRFCIGEHDGIARHEFIEAFAAKMRRMGASDAVVISAGPLEHNAVALSGMTRAYAWFEAMRKQ